MSIRDFDIIKKLGEGSYANVFKVRRKSDGRFYALKKVKLTSLPQKQKQYALNQVRIMASVNHPNIIAYKQAFIDQGTDTLFIVMQLAQQGDLEQKIKSHLSQKTRFQQTEIFEIFIQILQGLNSLHTAKILHRDLKSANIFFSSDGKVKLGDLNISKVNYQGLAYTQAGTPYYSSPEVWSEKPYNSSSDIWSLGCVVYQMAALRPPFAARDLKTLYRNILKGEYEELPNCYSRNLAYVVRCMLQVNPILRPSCERILQMSAVNRYRRFPQARVSPDLLDTINYTDSPKILRNRLPSPNYAKSKLMSRQRSRGRSSGLRLQQSRSAQRRLGDLDSPRLPSRCKKLPPSIKR